MAFITTFPNGVKHVLTSSVEEFIEACWVNEITSVDTLYRAERIGFVTTLEAIQLQRRGLDDSIQNYF